MHLPINPTFVEIDGENGRRWVQGSWGVNGRFPFHPGTTINSGVGSVRRR